VAHSDSRGGRLPSQVALISRLALKVAVRLSHWRLDAELAAGADPNGTPRLSLRAAELVGPEHRRRLAIALLQLANDARREAPVGYSVAVPVQREQVAIADETLAFAAQTLLFANRVEARGVAMLERLLGDGGSAVYVDGAPGALDARLDAILHHLVYRATPDGGPRGRFSPKDEGSVGRR
jgi:hypothetical protein